MIAFGAHLAHRRGSVRTSRTASPCSHESGLQAESNRAHSVQTTSIRDLSGQALAAGESLVAHRRVVRVDREDCVATMSGRHFPVRTKLSPRSPTRPLQMGRCPRSTGNSLHYPKRTWVHTGDDLRPHDVPFRNPGQGRGGDTLLGASFEGLTSFGEQLLHARTGPAELQGDVHNACSFGSRPLQQISLRGRCQSATGSSLSPSSLAGLPGELAKCIMCWARATTSSACQRLMSAGLNG